MRAASLVLGAALLLPGPSSSDQTLDYVAGPLNFDNSSFDFDNSMLNFDNSPYNYDNSAIKPFPGNGLYDNDGRRVGYYVDAPSGVRNIFDTNGNRVGYLPANRRK